MLRKAAGEIDAGDARTTEEIKRVGREQASLTTDPPAPRFTPLESKEYWDALSPEQKSFVLSQHLQWVPNVDGIPATVRDEANRAMIPIERTRLEAERKLLRDKIDDNLFRASFNNDDARLWLRVCCHVTRTRRSSIRAGVDDAVFYGSPVAGPR